MVELEKHLKAYGMRHCPIDTSLKIFQKKFTMHVIRNMLLLKQKTFNEFMRSIEGINTKTLSIRLKEMEGEGLIERKVTQGRPLRVEYSLTDKGRSLQPLLTHVAEFSMYWEPKKTFKKEKPLTVKQTFGTAHLSKVWD